MSGNTGRGEGLRGAAMYPARAAARAWRGPLEAAAEDVLASPEAGRILDRALAGPLPEEVAQSLVRHRVLERVMQELVEAGEAERLLGLALDSPRSAEIVDRVIASDAFRAALASTSSGLAGQVAGKVRSGAARLDVRISGATPREFAGVASRGLALVV